MGSTGHRPGQEGAVLIAASLPISYPLSHLCQYPVPFPGLDPPFWVAMKGYLQDCSPAGCSALPAGMTASAGRGVLDRIGLLASIPYFNNRRIVATVNNNTVPGICIVLFKHGKYFTYFVLLRSLQQPCEYYCSYIEAGAVEAERE